MVLFCMIYELQCLYAPNIRRDLLPRARRGGILAKYRERGECSLVR